MKRSLLIMYSVLLGGNAFAAEIPGIDIPYASYRKRMFENGFIPRPGQPQCGPYPETCMGNPLGSAFWIHPVAGLTVDFLL